MLVKELDYEPKKLIWKKADQAETLENLKLLETTFKEIPEEKFTQENLEKTLATLMEQNNIGTGNLLWPMRFALSGQERSPGPYEIAATLGRDVSLYRIGQAITKLV